MTPDLENSLYAQFPHLYSLHVLPANQSCMADGIAVGDGWYDILYRLSRQLQTIIDDAGLDPRDYCFSQVKEKFGLLRIYGFNYVDERKGRSGAARKRSAWCGILGETMQRVSGKEKVRRARERMMEAVMKAEEESGRTCEDCGALGEKRTGGWMAIRCEGCERVVRERREETAMRRAERMRRRDSGVGGVGGE